MISTSIFRGILAPLAFLLWTASSLAGAAPLHVPAQAITDPHFTLAPGYLAASDLPANLALLGAPPTPDSAAFARDEEARREALALRGTVREVLAAQDAELVFPAPARAFSCALGVDITSKQTPHLYTLMRKVLTDAGLSTYTGKNAFNRTRPFVAHNESTCRPDMEPVLRHDGSWPSGHSAAGWAWGLILAQVAPNRAGSVMARGLAFGQSRVICDAHWQSDVDAGRLLGAATVARLQSDTAFLADVAAARKEVRAAEQAGLKPTGDCSAEDLALRLR